MVAGRRDRATRLGHHRIEGTPRDLLLARTHLALPEGSCWWANANRSAGGDGGQAPSLGYGASRYPLPVHAHRAVNVPSGQHRGTFGE